MAVSSVERLAFGVKSYKAANNYRLEPQGIPALLDMEESRAMAARQQIMRFAL
jgi:hypothetical protein